MVERCQQRNAQFTMCPRGTHWFQMFLHLRLLWSWRYRTGTLFAARIMRLAGKRVRKPMLIRGGLLWIYGIPQMQSVGSIENKLEQNRSRRYCSGTNGEIRKNSLDEWALMRMQKRRMSTINDPDCKIHINCVATKLHSHLLKMMTLQSMWDKNEWKVKKATSFEKTETLNDMNCKWENWSLIEVFFFAWFKSQPVLISRAFRRDKFTQRTCYHSWHPHAFILSSSGEWERVSWVSEGDAG